MASVRQSVTEAVEGKLPDRPDPLRDYLDEITRYEKDFKTWEGRVKKIIERYRDERRESKTESARFNVLWSNIQTLVPATFSRIPQPDVSRRFRDTDPVGRVASLILERGLEFEINHYPDYKATMKQAVLDRFLGGRGTAWVRYEPHFTETSPQEPEDGLQVTEDVEDEKLEEELDYECAPIDYVHWKDFGHSIARTWEEVTCVWRNVYMSEEAVEERFGKDIAKKLPYDASPEDKKEKTEVKKQARVIELWDRTRGKAVWLSKSYKKGFLDERDDPLKLRDFFPCPRPLYSTMTNETLVPVPDFTLYQVQANELDLLSDRIDGLTKMLQLKGVYDASADAALGRLFTEGQNGTLLPVKNWAAFAEKGGLKGQIDVYDLNPLVQALKIAYEAAYQIKQQVYEIMGISDIVRGASDPNETLGAQELKGQFTSMRLNSMKEEVARFATEVLQLKAQVMCCKFNPQTLVAISSADQLNPADKQFIEPAVGLLIGQQRLANPEANSPNPLRSFRIEVAADSMVQMNDQEEKASRMEFLQVNGEFIKQLGQFAQAAGPTAPILAPLLMEMWKFAVTGFKVGKSIQGAFDETADKLKEMAQQPQPQQPDPEMVKIQSEQQAEIERGNREREELASTHQREVMELQGQHALEKERMANEAALETQKQQFEGEKSAREDQFNRWKAELEAATKIQVAEIGAKAGLDSTQIQANSAAAEKITTELAGQVGPELVKAAMKPMEDIMNAHKELMDVHKEEKGKPRRKQGKITGPSGQTYQVDMTEQ